MREIDTIRIKIKFILLEYLKSKKSNKSNKKETTLLEIEDIPYIKISGLKMVNRAAIKANLSLANNFFEIKYIKIAMKK
jgi:hypothetical protein